MIKVYLRTLKQTFPKEFFFPHFLLHFIGDGYFYNAFKDISIQKMFRKNIDKPKMFPLSRYKCNWTFLSFSFEELIRRRDTCHSHLLIKGILERKAIMNVTESQPRASPNFFERHTEGTGNHIVNEIWAP